MTPARTLTSTRIVALDFLSLLLLAAAAGIAAGLTLGGVALLFASQSEPAPAPARTIEHRSPQAPRGAQELPSVPVEPDEDQPRWLA